MKIRMSRTILTVAAAIAATVTLATAPALASTSAPALHPSAITVDGAARPAAAQAENTCYWYGQNPNGSLTLLGVVLCDGAYGSGVSRAVTFPNGTEEVFAVGTSHAVWTAWTDTSGGWHRQALGGSAYSSVTVKQNASNGWELTIVVSSSSGQHMCLNRGGTASSGWGSWFTC